MGDILARYAFSNAIFAARKRRANTPKKLKPSSKQLEPKLNVHQTSIIDRHTSKNQQQSRGYRKKGKINIPKQQSTTITDKPNPVGKKVPACADPNAFPDENPNTIDDICTCVVSFISKKTPVDGGSATTGLYPGCLKGAVDKPLSKYTAKYALDPPGAEA